MGTMTPKSTFTAKGSIAAATAASTPANLSVGNNGEIIVADSSAATGLRYNPQNALSNPVINGGMEIAQRGTAAVTLTAAAFQYPVDRWQAIRSSGTTGATAQQISSIGLTNFNNAVRIQRTAGNTAVDDLSIAQNFETSNSIAYAGKTVTLSFWARAGANYSTGVIGVRLYSGTGTDQSGYGFNFTGTATPISTSQVITTSWVRYAFTGTVASSATQLQPFFFYTPSGTAGAADYLDITGVQLDLGTYTSSSAPAFRRNGATTQGELAACQRYFWRNTATGDADTAFNYGVATSTGRTDHYFQFPVTMRTRPTSAGGSNLKVIDLTGNNFNITSLTLNAYNAQGGFLYSGGATGMTQFRAMALLANTTSSYVEFSAEI
jgi:hypothetical protein